MNKALQLFYRFLANLSLAVTVAGKQDPRHNPIVLDERGIAAAAVSASAPAIGVYIALERVYLGRSLL